MKSFIALALFALPLAASGDGGVPCIPDGTTRAVDFDLPAPGSDGVTAPAPDAKPWGGGSPFQWASDKSHPTEAKDADTWSPDDDMGDAKAADGKVSVPIQNKDGKLSGPNGEVQNGGTEGDCIEVYVEVSYKVWTQKIRTFGIDITPGGLGIKGTETEITYEWVWHTYTTKEKEVCPC